MKRIGIVRKVDSLGRIVIPSELRKSLSINQYDTLEIYTDMDVIILKKYVTESAIEKSVKQLKYDVINLSQELGKEKVTAISKILEELKQELKT